VIGNLLASADPDITTVRETEIDKFGQASCWSRTGEATM